MKTLVKLAFAAAILAAAPSARARDCDAHRAAPVYAPADRDGSSGWRDGEHERWRDDHDGWRHRRDHWREREVAELRSRFAALDRARADFYARPGHRRGEVRRFERWYASERAALERRWDELTRYAMR